MPLMSFGLRQRPQAQVATIVRTSGHPGGVRRLVRQAFADLDPNLQVWSLRTLQEDLQLNLLLPDMIVAGLTGLGALALVLTAVGLYRTVLYFGRSAAEGESAFASPWAHSRRTCSAWSCVRHCCSGALVRQ